MRHAEWPLQAAKAQLSEVVEAALRGEPQRITRRGRDAVVVLSEQAYVALKRRAKVDAPDFVAHLLAMPRQRAVSNEPAAPRETVVTRNLKLFAPKGVRGFDPF
jgi:prevent-host-death family protein